MLRYLPKKPQRKTTLKSICRVTREGHSLGWKRAADKKQSVEASSDFVELLTDWMWLQQSCTSDQEHCDVERCVARITWRLREVRNVSVTVSSPRCVVCVCVHSSASVSSTQQQQCHWDQVILQQLNTAAVTTTSQQRPCVQRRCSRRLRWHAV